MNVVGVLAPTGTADDEIIFVDVASTWVVELHGGVLDLQSEVGVGTTVTVRFPAERIMASLDHADSLDVEDRAAS